MQVINFSNFISIRLEDYRELRISKSDSQGYRYDISLFYSDSYKKCVLHRTTTIASAKFVYIRSLALIEDTILKSDLALNRVTKRDNDKTMEFLSSFETKVRLLNLREDSDEYSYLLDSFLEKTRDWIINGRYEDDNNSK